MTDQFDIDGLVDLLQRNDLQEVVLQLADEFLSVSVEIYLELQSRLPAASFYVVANSSSDFAIDDTAASHVNGQVIVYFGSLLEATSNRPVIVMHPLRSFDVSRCVEKLQSHQEMLQSEKLTIVSDPSLHWAALRVSFHLGGNYSIVPLPMEADLNRWSLHGEPPSSLASAASRLAAHLQNSSVLFIGEKCLQLDNLLLRFSDRKVYHYSPSDGTIRELVGKNTADLRERYGGIFKVKEAQTIGIILSTMGLRMEVMRKCLQRVQALLSVARKKYYSFIMGRINEAKLCNFPEVDVFCIISTEDMSTIKPKTFHVPVVTVFELEVGLGARPWDAMLINNLDEVVATDLQESIANIRLALQEQGEDSEGEEAEKDSRPVQIISLDQLNSACEQASALQLRADDAVTLFSSSAAEFFQQRTFRGLEAEGGDQEHEIKMGQVGIAASYVQIADPASRDIEDL